MPPPQPPEIVSAVYNAGTGDIAVVATEELVLVDSATGPWTVTVDASGVPILGVSQQGANVAVTIAELTIGAKLLSYAGGPFVVGGESGLQLQAFGSFPVGP